MSVHPPRSRPPFRQRPPIPANAIYLGTAVATRAPYWLPPEALARGVHLRGAIGAGKTSLIRRMLLGRGMDLPWVNYDFIGTGHRELEAAIAAIATTLAIIELSSPELAGTTVAFLRRFAFLRVGAPHPPVRIDLLRRRVLPDGRRERIRDVTSRALEVLMVKLNDSEGALRVRFHRIATALIAALSAADRPLTEGLTLLDDPRYIHFLDREIEARRFRTSDLPFLTFQRRELDHVLKLRPTDPTKSWRAFEEETSSTRNSLADFAPGSVLGDLFGEESLPLEDLAFGRTCLSITNREAEDLQKVKAYQAINAMLHALCLHRQDLPDAPPLAAVVDEPWWMRQNLPGILAVSRNLGVSYWLSHQNDQQFEDVGLRTMPKQLRSLTNLQIGFRPTSLDDAEDEVHHTTELFPDGLVQRFWASGSSDSDSASSTISRSWANALRYSAYDDYDGSSATSGHGEASLSSSGSSRSEHEVVNVVGFGDQAKYLAQSALRRPRFRGVVTYDGWGTEVDFAPAPTFPPVLDGVPILDLFRRFHNASWRARTIPRAPYDPDIRLYRWGGGDDASRASSAGHDAGGTQVANHVPGGLAPAPPVAPNASAPLPAETIQGAPAQPAPLPTFAPPAAPPRRPRHRRRPKRGAPRG